MVTRLVTYKNKHKNNKKEEILSGNFLIMKSHGFTEFCEHGVGRKILFSGGIFVISKSAHIHVPVYLKFLDEKITLAGKGLSKMHTFSSENVHILC